MYSMVLMAALTTGTDLPDIGRHGGGGGCCGCHGGMSSGDCYGGMSSGGCYGRGGCYGGGRGGCYGGGCGGGYGGGRAWSGGYGGGYAWGGYSPSMGYAYTPMMSGYTYGTPLLAGNMNYNNPGTNQSFYFTPGSNTGRPEATLIVHLPSDARLTIDGETTQSTSGTRMFDSPPLDAGKTYTYTLRGEIKRDGRTVNAKQTVDVRAGGVYEVNLRFPNADNQDEGINDRPNR